MSFENVHLLHMKTIRTKGYNIYFDNTSKLQEFIGKKNPSSLVILVDENTEKYCLHHLIPLLNMEFHIIKIKSGETSKSISTSEYIWKKLIEFHSDRNTLLINLGGGVIGDIGGFCASTFMRGIDFIQIPTTLLGQVDASIGGKTGIDFLEYKNIIGSFHKPKAVFIFTDFLKTLPPEELKSGYAEMLKHGLIADTDEWKALSHGLLMSPIEMKKHIFKSVSIKKRIVEKDPHDIGIRKILNFGHTFGHAIESKWMSSKKPLLHGQAVAIGMVCESYLSYRSGQLSESDLFDIRHSILDIYGHQPKYVKPVPELLQIMQHDKKNENGEFHVVLLEDIGSAKKSTPIKTNALEDAFHFYQAKL